MSERRWVVEWACHQCGRYEAHPETHGWFGPLRKISDTPFDLDVIDVAGIAERLNVPKDTVHKWRHRGLLPDPDYPLAVGPVWEWETIRRWAESTNRLP